MRQLKELFMHKILAFAVSAVLVELVFTITYVWLFCNVPESLSVVSNSPAPFDCFFSEYFDKTAAGLVHLGFDPCVFGAQYVFFPIDAIPRMDADLETKSTGLTH